jgi:hypothetical protein
MAAFEQGKVVRVAEEARGLVALVVDLGGREVEALAFPALLGPVGEGDRVVVNTTGLALGLGTGGVGFVLWNLDGPGPQGPGPGHIIKLRYTPYQTEVLAAEAPESPYHALLRDADSIAGMPVVACGLHSQVAGVAAGVKAALPEARLGYLMTDGAALPYAFSRLARALEEAGLIDSSCSAGHAFGAQHEAVNVFSGLAVLRVVARCDVAVVAMGPGIVGTATKLGFTGIEQGQVLDAAAALQGRGVAALRLSFGDERARHQGVSHHTLSALGLAARSRALVAVPSLEPESAELVRAQLDRAGISKRHELVELDGAPGVELLRSRGVTPTSMGRSFDDTLELHLAAGAAGRLAAQLLEGAG